MGKVINVGVSVVHEEMNTISYMSLVKMERHQKPRARFLSRVSKNNVYLIYLYIQNKVYIFITFKYVFINHIDYYMECQPEQGTSQCDLDVCLIFVCLI